MKHKSLTIVPASFFLLCVASQVLAASPSAAAETIPFFPERIKKVEDIKEQAKMKTPEGCTSSTDCFGLNDQYCQDLWKAPQKGNVVKKDSPTSLESRIYLGKSAQSYLSMAERMDTEALIAAKDFFAADLQKSTTPILNKLHKHMAAEKDDQTWYAQRNQLLSDFWSATRKVAGERVILAHPELKTTKNEDLTFDQRALKNRAMTDLDVEITQAKYAQHPNWKRVQRIFVEARDDLRKVIGTLDLPEATRKELSSKLEAVQLSLPLSDPNIMDQISGCDTTLVNAFYTSSFNKFTMCAGLFNIFQSDAAIYFVIAHELGHSIAPGSLLTTRSTQQGIAKTLQVFCHAKGPAMGCDQWEDFKKAHLRRPFFISPAKNVFSSLSDCLKPMKSGFSRFSTQRIRLTSELLVRQAIQSLSAKGAFQQLSKPSLRKKDGKPVPNDFFLRPDRYQSKNGTMMNPQSDCLGDVDLEIFTQIAECKGLRNAKQESQKQLFRESLKEFEQVELGLTDRQLEECGRECGIDEMLFLRLSRPTGEEMSDWYAKKAIHLKLSRESQQDKRRQFFNETTALFCPTAGADPAESGFDQVEKEYSTEPHPENTLRRHNFFSSQTALLLGCEIAKSDPGTTACDFTKKEK